MAAGAELHVQLLAGRVATAIGGAAIGGAANYSAVRTLSKNADRFFSKLPYSTIETTATETTATEQPTP